ncbi:MAG: single-stranded DNA-binding protein [Planctomycetes bacterium]|nr:single-stranded DNA-binding protein [Planctomycetota bacterium]
MANLNKVILLGRLTRDPEVRETAAGKAVCTMRLAINREFIDRDGNRKAEVVFLDVIAWGPRAEACGRFLAKGREVFVEGRLTLATWEVGGEKRSSLRVTAENVQFLGRPDDSIQPSRNPVDEESLEPATAGSRQPTRRRE